MGAVERWIGSDPANGSSAEPMATGSGITEHAAGVEEDGVEAGVRRQAHFGVRSNPAALAPR